MLQIYAHRAGRGLAAENTLFACATTLQHQIDWIDFDIVMTKDEEWVVTHDLELNPDTTRDSSGEFISERLPLSSLNYSQLIHYNVGGINPRSEYFTYFPDQKRIDYAPIPRLAEAISFVTTYNPAVRFQIEIKTDLEKRQLTPSPEMLAKTLSDLLKKLNIVAKCEVQSFDYRCLYALKNENQEIKTTFLTPPFEEKRYVSLLQAEYSLNGFDQSLLKMIHRLGGACWGPYQMDLDTRAIEEARKWGLKIVPWGYPEKEGTEFNMAQIQRLIEWGVDGIITDRPDKLHHLLLKRHSL